MYKRQYVYLPGLKTHWRYWELAADSELDIASRSSYSCSSSSFSLFRCPEADDRARAVAEELPHAEPEAFAAAVVDEDIDAGVEDEEEVAEVAQDEEGDGDVEAAAALTVREGHIGRRRTDLVQLDAEKQNN